MGNINRISIALFQYLEDNDCAPKAKNIEELKKALSKYEVKNKTTVTKYIDSQGKEQERVSTSITELYPKDSWEREIIYRTWEENGFCNNFKLTSVGKDGKENTEDDIVLVNGDFEKLPPAFKDVLERQKKMREWEIQNREKNKKQGD